MDIEYFNTSIIHPISLQHQWTLNTSVEYIRRSSLISLKKTLDNFFNFYHHSSSFVIVDLGRSWYFGHGTHGTWTEPPLETHSHNMSQRKDLGVPKVRRRGLHGDRVRSCPPHQLVCLIHGLMSQDVTGNIRKPLRDLVNEHQRVGGLSLLQALDDLAGHGSNLDFHHDFQYKKNL